MPKRLQARPATDTAEEQLIRRLAGARTATFDTVLRSRIVVLSWEGLETAHIAAELRCHPKTVRERISRFNEDGVTSLTERPKVGRKPRLTDDDRHRIITLACVPAESANAPATPHDMQAGGATPNDPPFEANSAGRPESWPVTVTRWTLDNLVAAAREHGISIGRSQLRRILQGAGFHWERGGYWIAPATVADQDPTYG
jgi:transposase